MQEDGLIGVFKKDGSYLLALAWDLSWGSPLEHLNFTPCCLSM